MISLEASGDSLALAQTDRAREAHASIGGRFFGFVYRTSLVYNQCWEDPAVDREALQLDAGDRVITITSAGCNALDYALLGPRVLAVDANPRQNHLLELKLSAIRNLDYDTFFAFFGKGGVVGAADVYRRALRRDLGDDARAYWDRAIRAFDPLRTRGGSFYYSGSSGLFALAFRKYLELSGLRREVNRILAAASIEEQVALYRNGLRGRLGDRLLRMVGSGRILTLLGVPEPQRQLVASHAGGVVGYLRECLDHVLSVSLLRENYFWSVYLNGGYDPAACPEYLRPEGYRRLRSGLADNVAVVTATLTSVLERQQGTFSVFVLLDHMDWLVRRPALLDEEWRLIFARAAHGARIIWRSGARDAGCVPAWAAEKLIFDSARAQRLHAKDRVGTYGSFHVARVA